jgi:hypothetical protein
MLDLVMIKHVISLLLLIGLSYSQGGSYALDFDGSNDHVLITYDNSFNVTNLTIEAWVYSGNFNQNGFIFEKGPLNSQYALFFETTNLTFRSKHSVNSVNTENSLVIASSGIGFTSNTWHHIVASYDGTTKKIFADGSLVASTARSGTLVTNSTGSIIGAYNAGFPHYYFNGKIDEVRIWNDARTAAEIKEYMHKEVASDASGLVAYYKMSNGVDISLTDNSSNSNTGTLTNMVDGDWVTSYAPIGDLNSSYETDVEAIWSISGTSASDASDGLTMTVSSALSTGNFAVFGNNNTSGTSASDVGSVGSTYRTGRIWQVDESGTVAGTITIDISDATGNSGGTGTASNFILLYRSGTSGDFSSEATGASISGDAVSFTSVSLADGYYAMGAQSDASLPVELTSFEVLDTRDNGITLHWITESEINNLGFILDRRTSITDWIEIASFVTDTELQGQGSVSHQTIYTYSDNTVTDDETYDYRIADVDYDGNKEYHSLQLMGISPASIPITYVLHQNYPNPFNPITTLSYDLPEDALVNITIYDMMGKQTRTLINNRQAAGYRSVQWNGTNSTGQPASAGLYLYTIQAGDYSQTKKMVLLK